MEPNCSGKNSTLLMLFLKSISGRIENPFSLFSSDTMMMIITMLSNSIPERKVLFYWSRE